MCHYENIGFKGSDLGEALSTQNLNSEKEFVFNEIHADSFYQHDATEGLEGLEIITK